MELSTRYTATSLQTALPATSDDAFLSTNEPPVGPRIFASDGFTDRSGMTASNPSFVAPRNTVERSARNATERFASVDQSQSREKRGSALGKCMSGEFRECRGGGALKDGAETYVPFDQNDRKETRGDEGKGTCQGLVREAMRRIDRAYGQPQPIDLTSAVTGMDHDMRTGDRETKTALFAKINAFQSTRSALVFENYIQDKNTELTSGGSASRKDSVEKLMRTLNELPQGALAFVGLNIRLTGAAAQGTAGHALLVQRLTDQVDSSGSSIQHRYAIFDPNNGSFNYNSTERMNTAMRNYLDSAYLEIGDVVTPDRVMTFNPRSSTVGPTPPAPILVPPVVVLPEPRFPEGGLAGGAPRPPHDEH